MSVTTTDLYHDLQRYLLSGGPDINVKILTEGLAGLHYETVEESELKLINRFDETFYGIG